MQAAGQPTIERDDIMAKLTEEMKDFISSNLAWVATIGKDGHVDLGPKMSTFVIDDTHMTIPVLEITEIQDLTPGATAGKTIVKD